MPSVLRCSRSRANNGTSVLNTAPNTQRLASAAITAAANPGIRSSVKTEAGFARRVPIDSSGAGMVRAGSRSTRIMTIARAPAMPARKNSGAARPSRLATRPPKNPPATTPPLKAP